MSFSAPKPDLVAYVPVPHRGYLEFFRAYGGTLWIFGSDIIAEFPALTRNLPAASSEEVRLMIESLSLFDEVRVLSLTDLEEVRDSNSIVMPDEDVSRSFAEKYLPDTPVTFDGTWRLRWHQQAVNTPVPVNEETIVSVEQLDRDLIGIAFEEAQRSSDWWRQVGAVLVKDQQVLLVAFNKHQPSEQSPYLNGDPRSNFGPGQRIDASTALHAEIGIIAEAAKRGLSMESCDLYVTTFPCPQCAYACANTGIRRLYYAEGYSLIEGAASLTARGIEIIRVQLSPSS